MCKKNCGDNFFSCAMHQHPNACKTQNHPNAKKKKKTRHLEELDEGAALVEAGGVHDDVLFDGAGDDAHGAVLEHLVEVLVQVLGLFL